MNTKEIIKELKNINSKIAKAKSNTMTHEIFLDLGEALNKLDSLQEKLEADIVPSTKMDVMLENANRFVICEEGLELEDVINQLLELEDKTQKLDFAIEDDRFAPLEAYEYSFTVESFLSTIDVHIEDD